MQKLLNSFRRPIQAKVLLAEVPVSFSCPERIGEVTLLGVDWGKDKSWLWGNELRGAASFCSSHGASILSRGNTGREIRLPQVRQPKVRKPGTLVCGHICGECRGHGKQGPCRVEGKQITARGKAKNSSHHESKGMEAIGSTNYCFSNGSQGEAERPDMGICENSKNDRPKQPQLWQEDISGAAGKTAAILGFGWECQRAQALRSYKRKDAAVRIESFKDLVKGKPLAGLTKRRQAEYRMCVGLQA